jgi:hypothetical protein
MREVILAISVTKPVIEHPHYVAPASQPLALSQPSSPKLRSLFGWFDTSYYWIEYRPDENRFIYVQKDVKTGLFGIKKQVSYTEHHTKRGYDGSIQIIRDIQERCRSLGYDVRVIIDEEQILGTMCKTMNEKWFQQNETTKVPNTTKVKDLSGKSMTFSTLPELPTNKGGSA